MTTPDYDPDPDPERVALLRDIADELQSHGTEAETLGATLYRISDLYDPAEETSPRDIYVNMRAILNVKESGGLDRDANEYGYETEDG